MSIFNTESFNSLIINQIAHAPILNANAKSNLNINQKLNANIKYGLITNSLRLISSVKTNLRLTRSILQGIQFNHTAAARMAGGDIFQNLYIYQKLSRLFSIGNKLIINQDLEESHCLGIKNELIFNQTLITINKYIRSINQQFVISSVVAGYVQNENCIVYVTGIPFPSTTVFTFGSLILTLSGPDFDNSDKIAFDRVNRTTRGGDLIITRDSQWPIEEVLIYHWGALKQKDIINAQKFVKQTLGQIINITDYQGRTYQGVIRTPMGEAAQPARSEFALHLEIELL